VGQFAKGIESKLENRSVSGCSDSQAARREFLCRASCLVLAALASAGVRSKRAEAFPVFMISAIPEATESAYDIPAADGVSIDSVNQVILVRNSDNVYALSLACPHQNTALRWQSREGRFQCPRHKARYQADGTFLSGRATRDMDRFAIRLEGQKAIVDLTKLYRSDQQKAEWQSAFVRV
jgi:nitrite reductase/ring-hydroxylating ferredoxin subunit